MEGFVLEKLVAYCNGSIYCFWKMCSCFAHSESDVGQDFHLVPKLPLLPRGPDLTSELWSNRLIHGQLYRWYREDLKKVIIRHWKYKRKGLLAGLMKREKRPTSINYRRDF
jgi:hypothetical protein